MTFSIEKYVVRVIRAKSTYQFQSDNGCKRNLLDNEGVKVGVLAKGGFRRGRKVLLLEFTSDWVLMAEDEVQLHHRKHCQNEMTSEQRMFYLSARASVVRSEHHNPRGSI